MRNRKDSIHVPSKSSIRSEREFEKNRRRVSWGNSKIRKILESGITIEEEDYISEIREVGLEKQEEMRDNESFPSPGVEKNNFQTDKVVLFGKSPVVRRKTKSPSVSSSVSKPKKSNSSSPKLVQTTLDGIRNIDSRSNLSKTPESIQNFTKSLLEAQDLGSEIEKKGTSSEFFSQNSEINTLITEFSESPYNFLKNLSVIHETDSQEFGNFSSPFNITNLSPFNENTLISDYPPTSPLIYQTFPFKELNWKSLSPLKPCKTPEKQKFLQFEDLVALQPQLSTTEKALKSAKELLLYWQTKKQQWESENSAWKVHLSQENEIFSKESKRNSEKKENEYKKRCKLLKLKVKDIPLKDLWEKTGPILINNEEVLVFNHINCLRNRFYKDLSVIFVVPTKEIRLHFNKDLGDAVLNEIWEKLSIYLISVCNFLTEELMLARVSKTWDTFLKFSKQYSLLKRIFGEIQTEISVSTISFSVFTNGSKWSHTLDFANFQSSFKVFKSFITYCKKLS